MAANPESLFEALQGAGLPGAKPDLYAGIARDEDDIRDAQRLHGDEAGLDVYPFDAFCRQVFYFVEGMDVRHVTPTPVQA